MMVVDSLLSHSRLPLITINTFLHVVDILFPDSFVSISSIQSISKGKALQNDSLVTRESVETSKKHRLLKSKPPKINLILFVSFPLEYAMSSLSPVSIFCLCERVLSS